MNNNIYIDLPEGFEIKNGKNGYSLFSTKIFKKGDFLYKSDVYVIPFIEYDDDFIIYNLHVKDNSNNMNFEILKNHTTIYKHVDKIIVWSFDSFVNHSCNPNAIMKNFSPLLINETSSFEQYALNDINIGDEITNNYLLYYYDDHLFECNCNYKFCFKNIKGFKYIDDLEAKKILVKNIDPEILKILDINN